MRVTNKMLTSRYTRDLNKSLSNLNTLAHQVETGRKFFKGSEDPIGAVKAYRLRREYLKNEDYLTNLKEVDSILTSAESNLMGINKNLEGVYTSYLKGITGTMGLDEREIISKELEKIQESMVSTLNANFNDKYLFSGTSMEEPPFKIQGGDLYYKGINVSIADENPDPTLPPADFAAAQDAYAKLKELSSEKMFIDIGLSLEVDSTGKVNENSVFDLSIPGINFIGFGKTTIDGKKVSNNMFDLIGEIRTELERTDFTIDNISPYLKNFETQKSETLKQITDLGSKTNYIDFIKTRTDDNNLNLNKKINSVEFVNPSEAIMNWKMQEYAYTAALQMGTKLLQPSFMDFMR